MVPKACGWIYTYVVSPEWLCFRKILVLPASVHQFLQDRRGNRKDRANVSSAKRMLYLIRLVFIKKNYPGWISQGLPEAVPALKIAFLGKNDCVCLGYLFTFLMGTITGTAEFRDAKSPAFKDYRISMLCAHTFILTTSYKKARI